VNVVVLTVDCLRGDRVGFMGYEGSTTPFLDNLAEDGVVFENAFATGPTTTQSMPGLMTGTYPSWFGGYPPIPESQTTLAEAFSDAGYTTVGIHSNPWLHPSHRFDAGFDVYVDITEGEKLGSRPEPKEGKTNSKKPLDAAKGRVLDTLKSTYYELPSSLRRVVSQSYFTYHYLFDRANDTAEMAVDRAIEAIDEEGTDDFFLWIHFMDVHRPYTLPAGLDADIWQTARITQPSYTNPTPNDQEHISRIYDQSVAYVDSQIKRLYQEFKRRGVDEETLFVVTSDHGEELGEHGNWFHRNFKLYDELLHVPLLIVDPDGKASHIEKMVSLTDVAPTVLERAGVSSATSMDGESLASAIEGKKFDGRDVVISEIYDPDHDRVAIRTREWKYIREESHEELYEIESEPAEKDDRSDVEEKPTLIERTHRMYMDHRGQASEQELDSDIEGRLRELGYLE
jgi:arylsulfatase A-like enzyme